jgi:hypothetical protein
MKAVFLLLLCSIILINVSEAWFLRSTENSTTSDQQIMVDLRQSLTNNNAGFRKWNGDNASPYCSWYGVRCESGEVTEM